MAVAQLTKIGHTPIDDVSECVVIKASAAFVKLNFTQLHSPPPRKGSYVEIFYRAPSP
jgi:hypothetical protein